MDEQDMGEKVSTINEGELDQVGQAAEDDIKEDSTDIAEEGKDTVEKFGEKTAGEVSKGEITNCKALPKCHDVKNIPLNEKETCSNQMNKDVFTAPFELHPYRELLENLQAPSEQLSETSQIRIPKTIKETSLDEIQTLEDLKKVIPELKEYKEIGVDVEYSDHGYKALTCLLQLSTVDKDYILYAMELKDEMKLLNEVFADPTILKIFHASENDLKWLQQDLDVYVVNMFDTQKALKILGYKDNLSLYSLLIEHNVFKDKSMQKVDFRKRPLPPKYKDYVRTDSHYLINIYHKLRNELIAKNLLDEVFKKCNDACKIVYRNVSDSAYLSVVNDIKKMHHHQLLVLENLNKWRHGIAEYLDQNPGRILSKSSMKTLALKMPTKPNHIMEIAKSLYVKKDLNKIISILTHGNSDIEHNMTDGKKHSKDSEKINRKRNLKQTGFGKNKNDEGNRKRFRQFHDASNINSWDQETFDLRNTLRREGIFKHNKKRF